MILLDFIKNIKTFLQKAMVQIGLKKFLRLKMLQTLCWNALRKRTAKSKLKSLSNKEKRT